MTVVLAIGLLAVGIALIVVEVLIPSFGLFSLMSIACIGGSIAVGFAESTTLGLILVGVGIVGIPTAIAFGFRLLSTTKFGDRLLLRAPDTPEAVGAIYDANRRWIGRRGTAATPLRPAGTADIDGERIPVVTEGELLDAGTPVEVVVVEGNRIVVRPTTAAPALPKTPHAD